MAEKRTGRKGVDKHKTNMAAKYLRKNGFEAVPPLEFYRAIFPDGELAEWSDDPRQSNNDMYEYTGILMEVTKQEKTYKSKKDPTRFITRKLTKRHTVCNDLKAIEDMLGTDNENFCFMSPISYVGKSRKTANARFMYALVIEIDNLVPRNEGIAELMYALGDKNWDGEPKIRLCVPPTYIVCSGTGVHLYWLLKEPVPLYPNELDCWTFLKDEWTALLWNKKITRSWHPLDIQKEPVCQGFRVVGTKGKNGSLVEAFKISDNRYTADELFNQYGTLAESIEVMPRDCVPSVVKKDLDLSKGTARPLSARMIECRKLYPDWYQERIVEKKKAKPKGSWRCHRGLYDWWLGKITENATVGHRYYCLHTLAIFALKCGIEYEELASDCFGLLEKYDGLGKNKDERFTEKDVLSALLAYEDDENFRHTRQYISDRTEIPIEPNKRNGNRQHDHLQKSILINPETGKPYPNPCKGNREAVLDWMRENGEITGRPAGSGTKQEIVQQWRKTHPTGKKIHCERDTGLSRHTVLKWWDFQG